MQRIVNHIVSDVEGERARKNPIRHPIRKDGMRELRKGVLQCDREGQGVGGQE